MSYVSIFKYDIFISYARVDNDTAAETELGWVDLFHNNLEVTLNKAIGKKSIKIWRDKEISGNQVFDDTIQTAVNNSAVFIAITSKGYINSTYCMEELGSFYKKADAEIAGLKVKDNSRIFNILIQNIPHEEWPQELIGTSGFPFNNDYDDLNMEIHLSYSFHIL